MRWGGVVGGFIAESLNINLLYLVMEVSYEDRAMYQQYSVRFLLLISKRSTFRQVGGFAIALSCGCS